MNHLFKLYQICGYAMLAVVLLIQPFLAQHYPQRQNFYLCTLPQSGLAADLSRRLHLASPRWLQLFIFLMLALWLLGLALILGRTGGSTRIIAAALALATVALLAIAHLGAKAQLQRLGLMAFGLSLLFNGFQLSGTTASGGNVLESWANLAALLALLGFVLNIIAAPPNSRIGHAIRRRLPQLAPHSCALMLAGAAAMLLLALLQLLALAL